MFKAAMLIAPGVGSRYQEGLTLSQISYTMLCLLILPELEEGSGLERLTLTQKLKYEGREST